LSNTVKASLLQHTHCIIRQTNAAKSTFENTRRRMPACSFLRNMNPPMFHTIF
jgi:hypothetical protein